MKKIFCLIVILVIIIIGILFIFNSRSKDDNSILYKISYCNLEYNSYDKRGYYIDTDKDNNYIIAMGRQNSGGYGIDVSKVKIDKKGNVKVTVKETKPGKDEIVTMALTTPTVCLELAEKPRSITIKSTKGEEFKQIR